MSDSVYRLPMRLAPIPVERVWGGERLLTELHPNLSSDAGGPIGETWEVSDVGDDPALHSVVTEGPANGRTLRELLRADPRALLGDEVCDSVGDPPTLPLLFKFIDAKDVLSVQVHPSDDLLRELGLTGYGKSEAWVIIDADPDAEIVYGLEEGLSLSEYVEMARGGRGSEGFRRVPVARGDVFNLPAGVLHAIGGGILLAEIQQSSDTTYRIYDWDRLGLDGRPRDLHLDAAACVVPPDPIPPGPLPSVSGDGFVTRIAGPPFSLQELSASSGAAAVPHEEGRRFGILSVLEGDGILQISDGAPLAVSRGDVVFFPAAAGSAELQASSALWALWMGPGATPSGD